MAHSFAASESLPERFHWVDALRGVAALVIVVFHYHHFYLADAFDRPSMPPVETFPYARFLAPLYGPVAANAVEMFWLISGFVFAHVYLPRRATLWQFGVARFARLYPLHLATLLYVAALQALSLQAAGHWQVYGNNDVRHFLLQLGLSSDWSTLSRGLSFNGPIWSVSLEILVYGMFFVLLSPLRRAPLVVALAATALSAGVAYFRPDWISPVRPQVFECSAYFFLGCLLHAFHGGIGAKVGRAGLAAAAGGIALAAGIALGQDAVAIAGVAFALVSAAIALDLLAPQAGRVVAPFGDLSYSLYLVHVPLQMTALLVADIAFEGDRSFAASPWTLPIYVSLSILLAWAAHRWFERPAGRGIRRLMMPSAGRWNRRPGADERRKA